MELYNVISLIVEAISDIGILIVTIILGIISYGISIKQSDLSEQSLKISLYNKKLDIYKRIGEILSRIFEAETKLLLIITF